MGLQMAMLTTGPSKSSVEVVFVLRAARPAAPVCSPTVLHASATATIGTGACSQQKKNPARKPDRAR
jgi:hypothetical protein